MVLDKTMVIFYTELQLAKAERSDLRNSLRIERRYFDFLWHCYFLNLKFFKLPVRYETFSLNIQFDEGNPETCFGRITFKKRQQ